MDPTTPTAINLPMVRRMNHSSMLSEVVPKYRKRFLTKHAGDAMMIFDDEAIAKGLR